MSLTFNRRLHRHLTGYPLLLIAAIAVAVLAVSPVAYLVLRISEGGSHSIDLIFSSRTMATLVRSVQFTAAVTLLSLLISLPIAWLTVRTDLPFRGFWSLVTALPLVVPSYVGAMTLIEALGPRGMLQGFLEPLGVDRLPSIYGFHGAVLALTLLSYPYLLLSIRTALWGLDPAMEESSRILGHRRWSTFLRITLPQLRPAIAGGSLLVALYTMSDFGAVTLLRFDSFTTVIYNQYQLAFDRTVAAATSMVLVVVALGLVVLEAMTRGRSRYYKSSAGASRRSGVVKLGAWKWPAMAFCASVSLLALILPLFVLLDLFAQGVSAGETFSSVGQAAWNSVEASSLAVVVTVVAAAPIAVLSVRRQNPLVSLLERVSFIGFALPGIVVALALVFLGIRYLTPFYQSMYLLVLAYMILFLPVALGSLRTALLQMNPHMEEAARNLGRGPLAVFGTVTLPMLRAGIIAACALVFLLTMKELPATLILGPTGFRTLATQTWSDAEAALMSRSALSGLVLVGASAVPMALLMFWERRDQW